MHTACVERRLCDKFFERRLLKHCCSQHAKHLQQKTERLIISWKYWQNSKLKISSASKGNLIEKRMTLHFSPKKTKCLTFLEAMFFLNRNSNKGKDVLNIRTKCCSQKTAMKTYLRTTISIERLNSFAIKKQSLATSKIDLKFIPKWFEFVLLTNNHNGFGTFSWRNLKYERIVIYV